jgi:hypothetical protein
MCNGNNVPQDSQPTQADSESRLMKGIVNGLAIMLPVYTLVGGLYVWLTNR